MDNKWQISSGSKGYTTRTNTTVVRNWYGTNASGSTNNSSTYEIRSYDRGDYCWDMSASWSSTDNSGTGRACSSTATTADTHHEGNFYNYPAAAAGTILNTASAGTDAPGSICPKGWRLPYGVNDNRAQSYYRLLNSFNYNNTGVGKFPANSAGSYNALSANTWAIIRSDPSIGFAEVRPGYYSCYAGNISNRGTYGFGWSSTVGDSGYGYYLGSVNSNVYPGTGSAVKGDGLQVRCVLRAS